MLEEVIGFKPDFPIKMYVESVVEYSKHWHSSLEMIFVLDGSVRITDSCFSCCLTQGDIYIFNLEDLHSIHKISETNIILFLYIDLDYFTRYFDGINQTTFICDSFIRKNEIQEELSYLRYALAKMLTLYQNEKIFAELEDYSKSLLFFLSYHFQYFIYEKNHEKIEFKGLEKYRRRRSQIDRMHRIANYIYLHYPENVKLKDIANIEFLNTCYVSHYIKQNCGLTFQELLSLARVEAAEKLIIDTNKPITIIASEVGFSSRNYLDHSFKKWYCCTPSEYRKRSRNNKKTHIRSRKYVEYDEGKAAARINEYLYGESQWSNMISYTDPISDILRRNNISGNVRQFLISGEFYKYLLEHSKINSYEKLTGLLTSGVIPDLHTADYNTFLKNAILYISENYDNTKELKELLDFTDN